MKYLKHWKYQCLLGAPFIPWFYVHWTTWTYDTMIAARWTHGSMDGPVVATLFLTIFGTIVFVIGYCKVHDEW